MKSLAELLPVRQATTTALAGLRRTGFAVLDQGLFSAANLLVNILLARWLTPSHYGAFAVANSIFFLVASFHTAALTEPMLVYGASRYAGDFRGYLGFVIQGHAWFMAVTSFVLALLALVLWDLGFGPMAGAFLGLALAAPFVLFLWLMRRAFYVQLQPAWAATGGAMYLLLMIGGLYALYVGRSLSPFAALSVMAGAGAAAGLWLVVPLRPRRWRWRRNATTRTLIGEHWAYAKWAIGAALLTWVSSTTYWTLLPIWGGLESTAALQATTNLVMPAFQAMTSVSTLLIAWFSGEFNGPQRSQFGRTVGNALALFLLAAGVYFALLLAFGRPLMSWLYGDRYRDYSGLLIAVGSLVFLYAVIFVFTSALRATGRVSDVFKCYAASSLVTMTAGLWLMATYGVTGAVVGWLLSTATTAVAVPLVYRTARRGQDSLGYAS